MKKAAQIGVPLLVLFVVAPVLTLALVVTMSGNAAERAADCLAQQQAAAAGAGAGLGASGTVRVAQANIKTSLSPARFAADLDATYATGADLVSLNETGDRSLAQLTRPGYAVYRDPSARGQARSTAVAWRTDRWRRLAAGRVRIVAAGPQKWDAGRSATWATLTPASGDRPAGDRPAGAGPADAGQLAAAGPVLGGVVSVVSVHHMINPAKYGPNKPRRRQLYRQAMSTLTRLVSTLGRRGPVFVAGDFNSQRADNDPWGPRRMLTSPEGTVGMRETMQTLGVRATHDSGGAIDYLFYQPSQATPTAQQTADLNSDHKLLYADFTLTGTGATATTGDGSVSPTTGEATWAGERYNLGQVRPQLAALVAVLAPRFGIDTVGGYRASATDPNGHPAGLAADFMVEMTAQGRAGGDQLAAYARTHAQTLGIDYLIWRQRIWSLTRAGEGWRAMADRGSPTANHYDHVHINVSPSSTLTTSTKVPAGGAPVAGTPLTGGSGAATGDCVVLAGSAAGTAAFAAGGSSAVVLPVPANLGDSDRRNWGGSGSNWGSWHTGTDFSLGCGTPVVAAHTGRVSIDTGQGWAGPWLVKVSQGPGRLTTWYAHMRKVLVAPGQSVTVGQQIGEVGSEGNVSRPGGCHLHFEVHTKNGSIYGPDNTDPSTWLARHLRAGSPARRAEAPSD